MSSTLKTPSGVDLIDDAAALLASNATIVNGPLEARLAASQRYYQHAGRPIFNWWGGDSTFANLRFVRFNGLEGGGQNLRGALVAVPQTGAVTGTEGLRLTLNGGGFTDTDLPAVAKKHGWPDDAYGPDIAAPAGVSGVPEELEPALRDSNSPFLFAGSFFEDFVQFEDPSLTCVEDLFRPGFDVIASKSGSQSTTNRLRERFMNTWRLRRPVFGWSMANPGAPGPPTGYVELSAAKTSYRVIDAHDQSIGDGGTTPSATGPGGFTLPLRYAAAGLRSQIKVYVWVYAAMSGTTNTGSLAVCNKDSSGTFQTTFQALTNNVTVSGMTFKWYPSLGAFDPAAAPYFNGYAGGAFDRVILGGKSSGATDSLRVGAWTMAVFHQP